MLQRLAAVIGIVAAMVAGAFVIAGPSAAADSSGANVSSLESQAKKDKKASKKAKKKANKACKKAKKAKGNKKAQKKCKKAKKKSKKAKKKADKSQKKLNNYNAQFFDVCKNGCKYRTVQAGANAAGKWQKKTKRKATVRVQPGTYVEGVLLHGKDTRFDFDNLTIMGVKANKDPLANARKVVLEGENAKTVVEGTPGWFPGDAKTIPANNAIEGRSIVGLKMKNMWARNYQNNTFFVWASNVEADNELCADFVMDNLVSSDTRAYGLFSRNCFGGKFLNSEGWNHGDSTLYIGETPCDDYDWNNRRTAPRPARRTRTGRSSRTSRATRTRSATPARTRST